MLTRHAAQGDKADTFFAILSGEVQREHVSSDGTVTRETLGVGDTFGVSALLTERPRCVQRFLQVSMDLVSVDVAKTSRVSRALLPRCALLGSMSTFSVHHSSELISITRRQYRNLVIAHNSDEVQRRFEILHATGGFGAVPRTHLLSLAATCTAGSFDAGQVILTKEAVPYNVYIIVEGQVDIMAAPRQHGVHGWRSRTIRGFQSRTIKRRNIATLSKGQAFGLNCLLHHEEQEGREKRATSRPGVKMPAFVVAKTRVSVLMVAVVRHAPAHRLQPHTPNVTVCGRCSQQKDLLKELDRATLLALGSTAVRGGVALHAGSVWLTLVLPPVLRLCEWSGGNHDTKQPRRSRPLWLVFTLTRPCQTSRLAKRHCNEAAPRRRTSCHRPSRFRGASANMVWCGV